MIGEKITALLNKPHQGRFAHDEQKNYERQQDVTDYQGNNDPFGIGEFPDRC